MTTSHRILIIGLNYAPEHAGIAPYTSGTARGLAAAGHQVTALTGFPYYPQWRTAEDYRWPRARLRTEELDGQVRLRRLRHYVPGNSTGLGRIVHEASFAAHSLLSTLGRSWRGFDAVIAISPSLLSVLPARILARRSGAAFGVVVQDLYANTADELDALPGRAGGAVRSFEAGLLRSADGVVAVHESFARTMTSVHGVDPDRITVIRNWTHVTPAECDRASVRAQLGWRPDELVVLHAGNMGAKQGLGSVVQAGALACTTAPWVRFVMMGDGARRTEVTREARDNTAVTVLPPVADERFPQVLQAADVLLVNARPGLRTVSAPSKLTSYFAVGRPVVAATEPDSPASMELAASQAGVRVAPGDPAALLDAVTALGRDAETAQRLGSNGRSYARSVLAAGTAVRGYQDWVRNLVAGG